MPLGTQPRGRVWETQRSCTAAATTEQASKGRGHRSRAGRGALKGVPGQQAGRGRGCRGPGRRRARGGGRAPARQQPHGAPQQRHHPPAARALELVCSAAGHIAVWVPGAAVGAPGRLGAVLQQAAAEEARRAGRRRVHPAPVLRPEQPHLRRQVGHIAPWRSTPGCLSGAMQYSAGEHLEQDRLPGVKTCKVGGPVRARRLRPGTDLICFASSVCAHALRMHPEPASVSVKC